MKIKFKTGLFSRLKIINLSHYVSDFEKLCALDDNAYYSINDVKDDNCKVKKNFATLLTDCFTGDRFFNNYARNADLKRQGKPNVLNRLRQWISALRFLPTQFHCRTNYISVKGETRTFRLSVYRPKKIRQDPLPLLFYIHGGGFTFGNEMVGDSLCRFLAAHDYAVCVSLDYALAPEHTFPAPLEDCLDAVNVVCEHAHEWGGSAEKMVCCGDSAGGNLTAALQVYMRKKAGKTPFKGQILFYPVTDCTAFDDQSMQRFATGYNLTRESMILFCKNYVNEAQTDRRDPLISPQYADTACFPPTLLAAAQYDVLRAQGLTFAQKLSNAGVCVRYVCLPGTSHGFITYEYARAFDTAAAESAAFLKRLFSGSEKSELTSAEKVLPR